VVMLTCNGLHVQVLLVEEVDVSIRGLISYDTSTVAVASSSAAWDSRLLAAQQMVYCIRGNIGESSLRRLSKGDIGPPPVSGSVGQAM
jgi:hypothetical protein